MDDSFKTRLHDITDWLVKEYSGIRTGQATPALLDGIKVEHYGTAVPINQVGSVGVEDARTLRISTWDSDSVAAVERAVKDADLGLSVASDSGGVRVIFPELTSERREQLKKLAKSKLEEARVSVRGARDEVMRSLDQQEKAGDLSEDEKFSQKEAVQKVVDETNKKLESLFDQKEKEITI